jgi:hypothetical protein
MSFFIYDSELDIRVNVDKSQMTVRELKEYRGLKTGTWSHPANGYYIQTYKVEVYDPIAKKWNLMNEGDIVSFTNCPRIKIYLSRA